MRIDAAFLDPNLLGAGLGDVSTWKPWLAILKAAFGLPLSESELSFYKAVSGSRVAPVAPVSELWAIIGRRSGKSRVAASLAVFVACFQAHKLAPGEVGTVLVLSATRSQARTVFRYALGFLQGAPMLAREVESITADEIRLRNGVEIAAYSNSYRTVRGRTILTCIFDEIAFWRDEASANPDREVYRAVLKPALGLVDKATEKFSQEITRLQNKVAAPAVDNTIRAVQLATELRIFLRDQTSADRRKEITKSLEAGDDQTMSAILSAPAMLSGLSQNEVDGFRLMWQRKRFPNELARIAQLEKAAGAVNLGGQLLLSHQLKMSAPAIVAQAKKFREASSAAIAQATGAH